MSFGQTGYCKVSNTQQRTPEWHEARKGRVTSSAVGAILGLSPYMTRADAMRNMVRDALGADPEFTGNVATEYGTYNEAGALVEYQMETLHTVEPVGFVTYEDWLGASPDGLVGKAGLVEIKCPYSLRAEPSPVFKTLEEQPHYMAQVQVQLYVTGREWCHFFQWAPHGTKMEVVYRDEDWLNENLPRLRQFYAEYLAELQDCPEEHLAPKRVEIDTPEAHKMVAEWDALAEQLELLTERKRDLLYSMVSMAGEKNALIGGRKLTMAERQGSVAYARVVKEHLPKLNLDKYRGKPSRYWQVR